MGVWDAVDTAPGTHYNYVATITAGTDSNIIINNFAAAGSRCDYHGTVSGHQITFANESLCGFTISNGTGTLSQDGRTITVSFTISDGSASETETGTWTKQ